MLEQTDADERDFLRNDLLVPDRPDRAPSETGTAFWRAWTFGDVRVRMVEYTSGYLADHWCVKGHILPAWKGSSTSSCAAAAPTS